MTWPDTLPAEAEPAINRADVDELEQDPVGIAMDESSDRGVALFLKRIIERKPILPHFQRRRD